MAQQQLQPVVQSAVAASWALTAGAVWSGAGGLAAVGAGGQPLPFLLESCRIKVVQQGGEGGLSDNSFELVWIRRIARENDLQVGICEMFQGNFTEDGSEVGG